MPQIREEWKPRPRRGIHAAYIIESEDDVLEEEMIAHLINTFRNFSRWKQFEDPDDPDRQAIIFCSQTNATKYMNPDFYCFADIERIIEEQGNIELPADFRFNIKSFETPVRFGIIIIPAPDFSNDFE